jgi:hypothetical protein
MADIAQRRCHSHAGLGKRSKCVPVIVSYVLAGCAPNAQPILTFGRLTAKMQCAGLLGRTAELEQFACWLPATLARRAAIPHMHSAVLYADVILATRN